MRLVRQGDDATGELAYALLSLANGLVGVEGVADELASAPCAYLPLSLIHISEPTRH